MVMKWRMRLSHYWYAQSHQAHDGELPRVIHRAHPGQVWGFSQSLTGRRLRA